MFGSALIALYSHKQLVNLDMLPFTDDNMVRGATLLGMVAIFCSLLALTRWFKFFFVVWTALAFYFAVKWLFFGFMDAPKGAGWFAFGALGAFFGAAWSFKTRRRMAIL